MKLSDLLQKPDQLIARFIAVNEYAMTSPPRALRDRQHIKDIAYKLGQLAKEQGRPIDSNPYMHPVDSDNAEEERVRRLLGGEWYEAWNEGHNFYEET